MKIKRTYGVLRRALSLLLALVFLPLCGELAPETRAAEKTLTLTPGRYIRWRKGLPPKDGQWHRILLIDTTGDNEFLQGNTFANDFDRIGHQGDMLRVPKNYELDDIIPGFDVSSDVNYTLHYYHTPAVRYVKMDNKNNHDSPAPLYYLRLSEWEGEDGNLTEIGLMSEEDAPDNRAGSPWAFVTSASDDDVAEGKVAIEQYREAFAKNFGIEMYNYFGTATYWFVRRKTWIATEEHTLFYADEIAIDTIADGQVVENGEIVNINSGSYLTLAAGATLTVKDGGILSIGSGMYNDGTIRVEKGGTLIVKQDAFIMPWQTGLKTGSIICDGGDVIVYSGGRVVCEGAGGFKFAGESGRYGTVFNYGAIITSAFTATGKARSFHNEGSVMLGYTVNSRNAQAFRDGELTVTGGRASVTGLKTGKINVDRVSDGVITGNGVIRP